MTKTRNSTGRIVTSVIVLGVVIGLAALLLSTMSGRTEGTAMAPLTISTADLETVDETRVFFGHQSVGANILDGIPMVYEDRDVNPPNIIETRVPPTETAFAQTYVGENTHPDLKMADFTKMLADGMGQWADVAFFKFCYLDVVADTDVDALFEQYQRTMSAAENAYPDTTFLYVTVPLTSGPGMKDRLRGLLGKTSDSAANNAARERFNALLREEYGDTGRVFDLAAIESTAPDGSRDSGTVDGNPYYALYKGYSTDGGHLTPAASAMVAEQLLKLIAEQRG